jgi:hypothetical protein
MYFFFQGILSERAKPYKKRAKRAKRAKLRETMSHPICTIFLEDFQVNFDFFEDEVYTREE